MARLPIVLDIPDNRRDELIAALRFKFGPVGTPPRDRTAEELLAGVKAEAITLIKQWHREYRKSLRENDDLPIT